MHDEKSRSGVNKQTTVCYTIDVNTLQTSCRRLLVQLMFDRGSSINTNVVICKQ